MGENAVKNENTVTMKITNTIVAILMIVSSRSVLQAQNCVDSSLIDLNAACPLIWAPVCGCNGITYGNDCEATFYGGVTSWTPGECVGGCMDMSGLDFGACDMFLGYTWVNGACNSLSGCGYTIGNIDYSPNFYDTPWECQQNCGNTLTDCINQWQIEQGFLVDCSPDIDPVCGCNGVEYYNACAAFYYGGVTNYTTGSCSANDCLRIPSVIDFGACAMPLGWARLEQGCSMLSGCSYIGQNGYDYSSFFFNSEEECLAGCNGTISCVDSSQIDVSVLCPAVVDPVCGCNGITYNNSCEATYYGGVTSYTAGPCTTNLTEIPQLIYTIQPNPFNTSFTLKFTGSQPSLVEVADVTGRVITTLTNDQIKRSVDASDWPQGIYIVRSYSNANAASCQTIMKY